MYEKSYFSYTHMANLFQTRVTRSFLDETRLGKWKTKNIEGHGC